MFRTDSIYSLTDFQRNTKSHLARLKRTGKPEVLTINGQAEVIVQSAKAYQELIDKLEKMEKTHNALSR